MKKKECSIKIESEKLLERKLGKEVKRIGGWSIKIPAIYTSGIPDRICLLPGGRIFFAEIKTTKEKTRKVQDVVIKKLRGLGFKVYIIDSTTDIEIIIDAFTKGPTSQLPE